MREIIEKKIKVKELKFNFENPRTITKKERQKLKKSLERLGDFGVFVIDEDNNVISGTQRAKILLEINPETQILVKQLIGYTEQEKKIINIKANELSGKWDNDKITNFLENININEFDFVNIIEKYNNNEYTNKIEIPIYEPTGKKVLIRDLYNIEKYKQKLNIIENKKDKIANEIYEFLKLAATRFIEINYKNVAEYYANTNDIEIKKLFEDLILVIIDYDDAIKNGIVEIQEFIDMIIKNNNEGDEDD